MLGTTFCAPLRASVSHCKGAKQPQHSRFWSKFFPQWGKHLVMRASFFVLNFSPISTWVVIRFLCRTTARWWWDLSTSLLYSVSFAVLMHFLIVQYLLSYSSFSLMLLSTCIWRQIQVIEEFAVFLNNKGKTFFHPHLCWNFRLLSIWNFGFCRSETLLYNMLQSHCILSSRLSFM